MNPLKVTRSWRMLGAGALCCVWVASTPRSGEAVWGWAAAPADGCWVTNVGAKCGTDTVLEWEQCGTQTCNTLEWRYENLYSCVAAANQAPGRKDCVVKACNKLVYTRKCNQGTPAECVLDPPGTEPGSSNPELVWVVDGYKASGDACTGGPPTGG